MRILIAIFAASLMLTFSATAMADDYQSFTLAPGFLPDPAVGTGHSGAGEGSYDAATVQAGCVGIVDNESDHTVTLTGDFAYLRFRVFSEGDTTLVIRKPDGTFLCDDDTVGLDPQVTGAFPAGVYQVWIGSYNDANDRYTLHISELP